MAIRKYNIQNKLSKVLQGLAIALVLTAASCKNNDNADAVNKEAVSTKDIYYKRLQDQIATLTDLLTQAVFGDLQGNYPNSSRKFLQTRIATLEETAEKIKNGTRSLNKSDMDNIILETNTVQANFIASRRTADFDAKFAELYVEGKSGGYIDFGNSPEYSSFENGFTVELWLKVASFGSFDYILSTFIDNYRDPEANRFRYGWGINYYNEGGNKSMRMTYVLGQSGLYEPGVVYDANNEWTHFAFVWNPSNSNTVDSDPNTFKLYVNGQLKKTERWNPTNYTSNPRTNLVGFNFTNFDGSIAPANRGTNGSMKHMHIWNSVKSEAQINHIKDNPYSVLGTESDLVCGWRFDKTVSDPTDIKDITDRHTAKVVGRNTWNLIN